MRLVCVWRRESDYGRMVEEWLTEFERRTGVEAESLNPDEPDGARFCRVYGVVEYPTLAVLKEEDGGMLSMWRGKILPTFDEVDYWMRK